MGRSRHCPSRRSFVRSPLSGFMPLLLAAVTVAQVRGAILFPATPDWQSSAQGYVSTGCALRDLDGDGQPDLVVANGNDIARQPVVVYRNQGGGFPAAPTWVSSDIDYQGQLDLADVDGDGFLDLAVAVYLGPGGFGDPGYVKLYHGNGDCTFSGPVWTSEDRFYCFSVAFGDIDMDGRPDLACTAGESYYLHREHLRAYRNAGGTLGTLPFWQSADTRYALDVTWGDVNGDGILDLGYACESNVPGGDPVPCPSEVYFGTGSTLGITPGWQSQDGHDCSNTASFGDLNGDGWLDLAIADNDQLQGGAGYGRAKVFLNDGHGNLGLLPAWTSLFDGYGSNVSWADVDHDGDQDLAAGSWWGRVRIYENQGGILPGSPSWQSNTSSVIENIAWEDVDGDGLESPRARRFAGDGFRRLFVLGARPVRIHSVAVDGVPLAPEQFFASPEQGWVTLAQAPGPASVVDVWYATSADLDFAVSNWDTNVGNYLFANRLDPTAIGPQPEIAGAAWSVFPNPAPGTCRIVLSGGIGAGAGIGIFDSRGARIRTLQAVGDVLRWDGRDQEGHPVPSGSYWLRVLEGSEGGSQRLILVR